MTSCDLLLSVNAGSSSLKISLYQRSQNGTEPVKLVLSSSMSSISAPPAQFSFQLSSTEQPSAKDEHCEAITDHTSAFAYFLQSLHSYASIQSDRVIYICHRVVHGGDYSEPVLITQESYDHLEKLSDLAPLHNGVALSVIKACIEALPKSKSIAYFDTSFHSTLPIHVSSYAINQDIAKKRGLKKYGFHGLSYSFILCSVSQYLGKPPDSLNLIILHLGSGASACVVKSGRSLDTSMGLTPLEGLPGATRSGSIDPSLIFHYTDRAGQVICDPSKNTDSGITMAEDTLNYKAGWKAITGTTDFGVIISKAELDDPDPEICSRNPYRLAFDLVIDRILHYIGSYHLKLNGEVDAIVFAGGIGEKAVQLRCMIADKIRCLGYRELDKRKNEGARKESAVVVDISLPRGGGHETTGRTKKIMLCKTDEQLEMARQCALDTRFWQGH